MAIAKPVPTALPLGQSRSLLTRQVHIVLSGTLKSIAPLMIGAVSIFLGNTILITMLPIRAQTELFSESAIGLMGTVHFAGFAIGCIIGPWMVTRVGHIRCFAGFGALMATSMCGSNRATWRARPCSTSGPRAPHGRRP